MDNKTINTIFDLISGLFAKNKSKIMEKLTETVAKPVQPIVMTHTATEQAELVKKSTSPVPQNVTEVDWSNPGAKIAKYFTVKDAIVLRDWNRIGNETDGLDLTVKKNLFDVFQKMDVIREFLGVPVFIKSAWRPSAYNVAIGGATKSAHMANVEYAAVDFWCDINGDGAKNGKDCDDIKAKLRPMLAQWGIRMEDNGVGATWVHIDTRPVPPGGNREFKP